MRGSPAAVLADADLAGTALGLGLVAKLADVLVGDLANDLVVLHHGLLEYCQALLPDTLNIRPKASTATSGLRPISTPNPRLSPP